jgi:hypothetical protein
MTELAGEISCLPARRAESGAVAFGAVCAGVMLVAALLAGAAPLGFSIATVFLFAGPHNWIEFRYFLSKMPAHWGPLRRFFVTAIGGVVGLSALFISYPVLARRFDWDAGHWSIASSVWNSLLVIWIALLIKLHARQGSAVSDWTFPAAFALLALAWAAPQAWDLALVYLHPLVALWFLDRELKRRKPEWRGAYHACLALVPVVLILMWWRLSSAPPLVGQDMLSMRITRHAGAEILPGLSAHALVSTHTFLEMLHYGVWIVGVPLLGLRAAPWKLGSAPLLRRSARWRAAMLALIALGALAMLILWAGFVADYPLTRDIYFTVAIAHVLAEVPFLLRTI